MIADIKKYPARGYMFESFVVFILLIDSLSGIFLPAYYGIFAQLAFYLVSFSLVMLSLKIMRWAIFYNVYHERLIFFRSGKEVAVDLKDNLMGEVFLKICKARSVEEEQTLAFSDEYSSTASRRRRIDFYISSAVMVLAGAYLTYVFTSWSLLVCGIYIGFRYISFSIANACCFVAHACCGALTDN